MNDYGEMFYGTLPPDTQDFRQVLAGIGRTIRERATTAGQRIVESAREARALQDQAFGDPTRPTRVTDEAALRRLTDMIMAGPLGFAPAGITAYHGSPYLFRMFDPAKVGTGEGAQAYGVGSGYTAEARPVAEGYRKTLSKDTFLSPNGSVINKNKLIDLGFDKSSADVMLNAIKKSGGDFNKAAELVGGARPRAANFLQSLSGGKLNEGYLYKGDIPDEILPKFLDWDKKFSEQTTEVKEAIKKYWDENKVYGDPSKLSGAGIYDSIVAHVFGDTGRAGAQKAASAELEKIGVRGIRYLDQGSRGEGKGTSNFIPFRAEDYKIQEINDIPLQQYIEQGLL